MKIKFVFFAVAVAIMFVACNPRRDVATLHQGINVRVLDMEGGSPVATGREYVGTIEESFATNVNFETTGRVTAVYVRDGQRVGRGQLLATIDTATPAAAYAAAKATLDRAEDGYRRAKQVYDRGSLPEVKWVEVRSQLDQARSAADIARRALENCRLYSPVDGIVGGHMAEVGTVVSPATAAVRIVNVDRLFVKLDIPEVDINKIAIGDKAQVRVMAVSDTVLFNGRVEERGVEADMLSHSYKVRVAVESTHGLELMPGMVCRVRFADEASPAGFEVPRHAVQLDPDGRRFVWIVDDSLTAAKRYVGIGDMTELGVVIDSGLTVGDRVVTDGMAKLSTGSHVKVL